MTIVEFKQPRDNFKVGEIRCLPDGLAQSLIEAGIAAKVEGRLADIAKAKVVTKGHVEAHWG